uniref:Testis expressed 52 n=1 Tax=Laticauda laticaudata TaxID=8630 RepID=A0A8C5SF27_LATLA
MEILRLFKMSTWKERQYLCVEKYIAWPGFSPRPYHKLATQKPPYTDSKIKVCQKIRCPLEEAVLWHIWGYHTWLDVGRLPPVYRSRPDKPFDSNTWRWITAPRKPSLTEPPIPPPSLLDGNTYTKFIEGEGLFVDLRHKKRVLGLTQKELNKCEQLKFRSECRAPPLDAHGNIMPPEMYKHLISGRTPASVCVALQPVVPSSPECWNYPCPSFQPHYQDSAVKFALKNSGPLYKEVVDKYQELVLSGRHRPAGHSEEDPGLSPIHPRAHREEWKREQVGYIGYRREKGPDSLH